MSNYKPLVGDRVEFIDSTRGTSHVGVIHEYKRGRDTRGKAYNMPLRDYLVLFDEPLWEDGPGQAWVAAEDMNLIKSSRLNKPTVTYASSSTSQTARDFDFSNLVLEKNNKLFNSTISTSDRPWTAYYVTADEFFEVLRVAFDDTYGGGSETPWHPEDMYTNVSCVLEVVTNTLANMANLKSGRGVKGIKES